VAERVPARPDPPWLALACLVGLCLAAWQIQAALPLNHDVGWLLLGARRLLEPGPLSADRFVDVTPPPILALYALPVMASRALGVSEIAAFRILVIGLAVGSLLLCRLAGSRLLASEPPALLRTWLVVVGIPLLPLVGYDFGQREHLITLLLLPYLVNAAARAQALDAAPLAAIWIGAAAGLAIGMKPQFALVVLAVEGVVWRARLRRPALLGPELAALAAAVFLAAAWTAWCAPDYLRVTLPLVWETYDAYHTPLAELVRWFDLPLLAAPILIAARARGDALRALARVLAAAALAAYAAYLWARTDWDYHRYPFGVLAIAALGLPLLRPLSLTPVATLAAAGLAAASLFVAPLEIRAPRPLGQEWAGWSQGAATAEILRAVDGFAPVRSIFLFSSSVAPAFPAVNYTGVDWASRFSCLWLLPAVMRARAGPDSALPPERRQRLEAIGRDLAAAVSEDLARDRPELVLVPRAQQHQALGEIDLDLLAFFQGDPGFQKVWSAYAPLAETPGFRVYALRQP
jgi:hypothetical protein